MFLRYFVEIPTTFEELERRLLDRPEEWIPGLATLADARGQELLAEVGFGPPHLRVGKSVLITLGEAVRFPSKTVLPLTWKATGTEGLFPGLEGDLEVAGLGPARSQLSISARYRPPLGRLGSVIDRALLHRVAEATVKDFLDRAAEALAHRDQPARSAG
jgi:hypothetical protein